MAPPINDDLANATLITANITLSGTTVDSTVEAGQETSDGWVNTVWYRIEVAAPGDMKLTIKNADYIYYADLYAAVGSLVITPPSADPPADFADLVQGYDNEVDDLGAGDGSDFTLTVPVQGGDVYYLLVTSDSFSEGDWGTFQLQYFMPAVYVVTDLVPNLSSPTVSESGGWVKDQQYRVMSHDWTAWKGELDYTKSFHIDAADMPPAGWYRVELLRRYGSNSGSSGDILFIGRINDLPEIRGYFVGELTGGAAPDADGDERYIKITQDDGIGGVTVEERYGGPFGLKVASGDVFSICMGQFDEYQTSSGWPGPGVPVRFVEVSAVRFTELETTPIASTRWRSMKSGSENGSQVDDSSGRLHVGPDGLLYVLMHMSQSFDNNDFTFDPAVRLGIWRYTMTGTVIEAYAPDNDAPIGQEDILLSSPETLNDYNQWADFTIMPNGDIYVVAAQSITSFTHVLQLRKWDSGTELWSTVTDDLSGHGNPSDHYPYSVAIDNDGTDVFVAWGEQVNGSLPYGSDDFWWRCKKYDVGGNSFTELGSGQTADNSQLGGPSHVSVGTSENPLGGLKCSPAGVPWVHWCQDDDPDFADFTGNYMYIACWNGSAWEITQVPYPSTPVPDHADSSSSYGFKADGANNRINDISDDVSKTALCFTHHDGPNEYPAVFYNMIWDDLTGNRDWGEFVYYEFDGATFDNEVRFTHGSPRYPGTPGDPLWEGMAIFQLLASSVGGFQAGFVMRDSDTVPYIFVPMVTGNTSRRELGVARLLPDGSAWEGLGNFQPYFGDSAYDPEPGDGAGEWVGLMPEAGIVWQGKPVTVAVDWTAYWGGTWLAVYEEVRGNIVLMNWRSATRQSTSRRVLAGA